ncbi:MAG: hypothetical protein ACO1PM_24240 [Acidovorax sp.]
MHRFSLKAILAGVVLMLLLLPAIAYGLWYLASWWFQAQGAGDAQMAQMVTEFLDGNLGTLALLLAGGAMCIPGGYVTARLAPAHPYANNLVVALLLTAISIGLAIGTGSGWDWWFDLANALFTVAGCWLGGWLVARRRR